MVIDDLNGICIPVTPYETDTPLVIDPDTVLSLSFTSQCLKAIGRWDSKIFQSLGVVQHSKFSAGNGLDIAWQFPGHGPFPDLLGFLVLELEDHGITITLNDI